MKKHILFLLLASITLLSSSCERLLIQSDTDFPYETAQFLADYVQKNEDKIAFETPELYELMKVAISFTDYSKANPGNITNTQSAYFREVQSQFQDYKSHALIQKLNDRIKGISDDYKYRDNSYGFEFDKNNKVVFRNIYPFIDGGFYAKNLFKELIPDIEDFAEKLNCKDGILRKGKTYIFKKNYRFGDGLYGGDALWYVLAKDKKGKIYKGIGLIETEGKL